MTACSSWPYEANLRQGTRETHRAARLDLGPLNGSHHIFIKAGQRERIVIPIHGNSPLKIGILRNQMKIAGLTEGDL